MLALGLKKVKLFKNKLVLAIAFGLVVANN